MPGMQFEYDEHGGTFYYFLLSFIALILFPATYYLWPSKSSKDEEKKKVQCHCYPCNIKRQIIRSSQPWKSVRKWLVKLLIIGGWIFFVYIAYKASKVELDFKEFDPYAELGIDRGADVAEIKKAYRKLSLIYHPDRETGDSVRFMYITKAYDALTDEESRKNWEEYGNPDGPGATQVGIALPKWIVEKQNSIWVLGMYALVFMIILPLCVGIWWYQSIKYSAQQVLIDTTRLYRQFIRKWPNMIPKRVIMVLGASLEFCKRINSEMIERPSDNVEIPELIRSLPGFNQNTRDHFSYPYCVKARALLESHFNRKELPPNTLEIDRRYILKKCPYLLNELIHQAQQMHFWSQADASMPWKLNVDTIENVIKTCQMVVQGTWAHKSPFLQFPHISEDITRHFVTKKRNIRTLRQFACMKEDDRRSLLRSLSDEEYRDVIIVCSSLPNINMKARCEVKGEDDSTISAGALVTLSVELRRDKMINSELNSILSGHHQHGGDMSDLHSGDQDHQDHEHDDQDEEEEEETGQTVSQNNVKAGVVPKWTKKKKKGAVSKKQKKKVGGAGKKVAEEKNDTVNHVAHNNQQNHKSKSKDSSSKPGAGEDGGGAGNQSTNEESDAEADDVSVGESEEARGEAVQGAEEGEDEVVEKSGGGGKGDDDDEEEDDEAEWMAFVQESKKENALETKSKETHPVHCPYFPVEKFEWWWLYISDVKNKQLIAGPLLITTLTDVEQKELRFPAPLRPGVYQYQVILRSDSYLGIDITQPLKLDVKEAKKAVENHPQWDISDDEDDDKKNEAETESDDDDDDDDDDVSGDDE